MDTIKKISLGVGIGLAISAYVHHEDKEKEEERKRDALAELDDHGRLIGTKALVSIPPVTVTSKPKQEKLPAKSPSRFRLTQLISRAERCFPNAVATLSSTGQARTYAEFGKRIRSAASAFVGELDIKPGDRVGILALNSESYLESYFSISFAGALPVPLNIRLSIPELVDTLNDCACKFLMVDEPLFSHVTQLWDAVDSLVKIITFGDPHPDHRAPPNSVPLETLIESYSPIIEPVEFEGCDGIPANVYGLFYTGGTTGKSKAVMLTHEGLIFNAYTITNMMRYTEGIKYLHATPMFHLASGTATFGVTMTGGTHIFIPKFTADGVLRTIQERKVTHALLVPSMFQLLLSVPNISDYDLRSVRYFHYGGSAMFEKLLQQALKAFPGAKFVQGYGMTEASPLITFLGPEHHMIGSPVLMSVGQCVPHGELRILDSEGVEVPPGTVGEICYRGPNVMVGYYNRPETTAATLRDGWLRTGDGGKMNEQGFLFICDRLKDTIVTAGESVYSQEVEQCISKLDGVLGCAVIGLPDPVLVEKVAAIVVVKKDSKVTEEKVMDHCKARIARYKCPKLVILRTEPLPLSGAGKVLKNVLREPFWKDSQSANNIYSASDSPTKSTYDSANGK
jgi:long-chain acyl-CoA synthetase